MIICCSKEIQRVLIESKDMAEADPFVFERVISFRAVCGFSRK
ncbi:MAG: hypothetical protein NZO16_01370 [Deltaproteobacteria bacterium]|nr:hypothetical protein [Deltaproteobacteria bacterium]